MPWTWSDCRGSSSEWCIRRWRHRPARQAGRQTDLDLHPDTTTITIVRALACLGVTGLGAVGRSVSLRALISQWL